MRSDDGEIRSIAYEEVEHLRVTRDFLNAPDRCLKNLAESTEASCDPQDREWKERMETDEDV